MRHPGDALRDGVRFQVAEAIQVTPGYQLIIDPSLSPAEDVVGIFQVRVGFVF